MKLPKNFLKFKMVGYIFMHLNMPPPMHTHTYRAQVLSSRSFCGVTSTVLSNWEIGAHLAGPPQAQAPTCLTASLVHWHSLLELWIHRSYLAAGCRPGNDRNTCQGRQCPSSLTKGVGLGLSTFMVPLNTEVQDQMLWTRLQPGDDV